MSSGASQQLHYTTATTYVVVLSTKYLVPRIIVTGYFSSTFRPLFVHFSSTCYYNFVQFYTLASTDDTVLQKLILAIAAVPSSPWNR